MILYLMKLSKNLKHENIIRYPYFLWFISGDFRLDITWKTAIKNTNNEIYLSVVSIWEAMIKYKLGNFLYLNYLKFIYHNKGKNIKLIV
jgi:hypothetical protein